MIIFDDIQGSDEWKARRRTSRNASEAPIIMGASKNVTRTQLLDMKVTGTEQEFSAWFEKNVLDRGHEIEDLARPFAEAIVGEELYPVSGSTDDGYLSASPDGMTMLGEVIWECKQWNEQKADDVRCGKVPDCDLWQVIQQLVVTGAEKCLYMITDGSEERTIYVWRSLQGGEEGTLRAAWAQFDTDRDVHQPKIAGPEPTGKAPESLPALHIEVTGMVTASNLEQFKDHALAVIGGINRDLQSDQDFADAEKTVKWLGDVETRLDAAKDHALSQTASIDQLFRALDDIKAEARRTRLDLDKLVKARKEARREEIRRAGVEAFRQHIDAINTRLVRVRLPEIAVDFAGVMKGKKTIASLENAVSTELARAKIEADLLAADYTKNLATIAEVGKGYEFLFSDVAGLVTVNPAHLPGIVKARITTHKEDEQRKLEAERERIRREEEAKAQRQAEAVAEQERQRIRQEEQAKAKAEAEKEAAANRAAEEDAYNAQTSEAKSHGVMPAEKPRIRQVEATARPTDAQIINTLAAAFKVSTGTVMQWLSEMQFNKAA